MLNLILLKVEVGPGKGLMCQTSDTLESVMEAFGRQYLKLFSPLPQHKSAGWLMVTLLLTTYFNSSAFAQQDGNSDSHSIRIWHKNAAHQSTLSFLQLALEKAYPDDIPRLNVITVDDNEVAFSKLEDVDENARLDIVVSAVSEDREDRYLPIYVPLDRGLLGFRLCMVEPMYVERFSKVKSVTDFARQSLRLTLVKAWPDVSIMRHNQIPLHTTVHYNEAIEALQTNKAHCFSRSVIEIDDELKVNPQLLIEPHIALIYPLADIIYVNPNLPKLHQTLTIGLELAIEDNSYFEMAEKYYAEILTNHGFYSRKLLIMQNPNVTDPALEAINRFGIASFIKSTGNTKS
ncbi:hypothetical protein [Planctobacterium marinum]|uniref:Solute-binding protein family 3/N-terminal domain-containing protein n=1 Tax=Planctobacterium marinum TaxID=1631968 RepID=A0AA48HQV3_9ALTE|nr:hypothetical protein MACH26_25380 [Planctobacterium marinum]